VAAAITITAAAPVRTCDCGGWTDTWFARRGAVFHVAVNPGVRVTLEARDATIDAPALLTVHADNYGHRYSLAPGTRPWVRHPLIEAAVESVGVPARMTIDVRVQSAVPPGASTGTSAAVCVAIVGALRALWGHTLDAGEVARAAHRVEVDLLGQQSGVQDQYGAAFGGINYIEITDYPSAERREVRVPESARAALESQLVLVYLGRTHDSSAVHEEVIRGLERPGSPGRASLDDLRAAAAAARRAVEAGDLASLGAAMRAATEGQRRLHPSLVSGDAQRVIDAAASRGALGWKVNGAGGEGGSLAILCPPGGAARARIETAIMQALPACRVLPTAIAPRGLEITFDHAASRGVGA
jgi:D-glycero-alpha-D-manno-heptose-7-phosphate kinase